MQQLIAILLVMMIIIDHASTMYIPQDIEILDGFEFDEPMTAYPHDSYYEAKSLTNSGLLKAIRNKRSPIYHVLESPGLRSHFHLEPSLTPPPPAVVFDHATSRGQEGVVQSITYSTINAVQPSDDNDVVLERAKRSENPNTEEKREEGASLPVPEKQVMDTDFYRKGSWNVHSFNNEYSKVQQEEDDSMAEATINEGIKGRTPRVNFITNSKKKMDEGVIGLGGNSGINGPSLASEVSARDYVRSTMIPKLYNTKSRYEKVEGRMNDNYEYPSRSYDPYLRRYDRYDDQYTRYDPYYENYYVNRRRYDPYDSYSPRMPGYPEPYYEYPDSRYDVPEPRDYRQVWFNDIYDRVPSYPTYPTSYDTRNRRIIYYAHLPEVIRTPPSVDLTYRYAPPPFTGTSYAITPLAGAYRQPAATTNRATDTMGFVKREKKDFRNFAPNYKNAMNVAPINKNGKNNNNNNNNNSNKEHRE